MREIKFRAWDSGRNRMIAPGIDGAEVYVHSRSAYIPALGDFEDLTLLQFTGLKDKNGVEIYEGDVIRLIDDVGKEVIVTCEFGTVQREVYGYTVNLCDITGFYFRKDGRATFPIVNNYAGKRDLELFEVIGNIHQHPELLKS